MTNPNELLPCQVSDAITPEMIEAGLREHERGGNIRPAVVRAIIKAALAARPALTTASTIPTDAYPVGALDDLSELLEALGNMAKSYGYGPDQDWLEQAIARLSTIPSAGELREAVLEESARVADNLAASPRGMMGDADQTFLDKWTAAKEACEDIADGIRSLKTEAALSIQTISGKGMRGALEDGERKLVALSRRIIKEYGLGTMDDTIVEIHAVIDGHRAALADQGERG